MNTTETTDYYPYQCERADAKEPCWGEVECRDEWGDGDDWHCVFACEGHSWLIDDKYEPKPK
jgi:hypothetical protein